MKVIIYMAPTPNGMIAKENFNEDYVSANDWRLFVSVVKRAGCVVMGRNTFSVAVETSVFPIGGALNVVLTNKQLKNRWGSKAIFTDRSPRDVLKLLDSKSFATVIVAGAGVSTSFLKQNLVDEIWLDFQPEVFGTGTRIFTDETFDAKLKLLGIKKISKNEVQLRYRVVKKRS